MRTASAPQRLATVDDVERIQALMRTSVREVFPRFYDARQTASAIVHIARLDLSLIEDGTYFVHEANGELVACGDWTRRGLGRALGGVLRAAARAEGFQSLVLVATLPGEPLYRAFGFEEVGRTMLAMPDGVETAGVEMRRPIQSR